MSLDAPERSHSELTESRSDDAEVVQAIAGFLDLSLTGQLMSIITGFKRASLSDVLTGKTKKSSRHAHLQILDQLVKATAEWQRALGGTDALDEG